MRPTTRPGSKRTWAGRAQRAQLYGLVLRLSSFFFFPFSWEVGNEVIFAPVPPGGCMRPGFMRVRGRAHVFAVAPGCARCARKVSGSLGSAFFLQCAFVGNIFLRPQTLPASSAKHLQPASPTNQSAVPVCAHREPAHAMLTRQFPNNKQACALS